MRPQQARWCLVADKGAYLPRCVPLGQLAAELAKPGTILVATEDAELTGLDEEGRPYRRAPRLRVEEE